MTHRAPERESKTFRNVMLTGCVGCLGLVVIAAAGISLLFFWSKSTIGTPAVDFIDAIDSGNYSRAWELTGGQWRDGSSFEDFEATYATIHEELGSRSALRSLGFNFNGNVMSPSKGGATYSADYENATVFIKIELQRGDEQWYVVDARYDRRLIDAPSTCPRCGNPVGPAARFCSECGQALDEAPLKGDRIGEGR